jgi:hypothetical protein
MGIEHAPGVFMAKSVEELLVYQKPSKHRLKSPQSSNAIRLSVTRGFAISWAHHQSALPP